MPPQNSIKITDWLTALGTVGAVFVALFFFSWGKIESWWQRPKLRGGINFSSPDCHLTKATITLQDSVEIKIGEGDQTNTSINPVSTLNQPASGSMQSTDRVGLSIPGAISYPSPQEQQLTQTILNLLVQQASNKTPANLSLQLIPKRISAKYWWFRIYVENAGKTAAKDVEVVISNLEKKVGGSWELIKQFLPSNLLWTHSNNPMLPMLLPGTKRNIDLGYMINPSERSKIEPNIYEDAKIRENQSAFCFRLSAVPNRPYHVLSPGTYRFWVTIGASNCAPEKVIFELQFNGTWDEGESAMLDNVTIKKV